MPTIRRKRKYKTIFQKDLTRWDHTAEFHLVRNYCVRDFWMFFTHAFGAQRNPKGQRWIEPRVHYPLAKWFEEHVKDWLWKRTTSSPEQKHLAVLVHREVGKTTMITQAGQLWLHLLDPEMSSYTGAEKTEHAQKSLAAMKAVLDGSDPYARFTQMYGNWAGLARTWTGKEIVHSARRNVSRRDPSLGTFAVETSIVGAHPDAIFYDDPISYERLSTDANWFQAVNSQVTSLFPVIQSDGLIVWVGTRYGDDDHFGVAFRDEGVRTITGMDNHGIVPDPEGKWNLYFMAGRDRDGVPSTPKVWPERRLKDYQRRDNLRYAAQVMNDPQISEHNPITRAQLEQCLIDIDRFTWGDYRYLITCDHAFSDGSNMSKKDETVMQVWGHATNGTGDVVFVEGYGSKNWRGEDLGNRIVSTVQRYRSKGLRVFGVTNDLAMAGQKGTWRANLLNYFADANIGMPPLYEFSRGSQKKYNRLVHAAQFWVNGHVRVIRDAPGVEKLFKQMSSIGQYAVNKRLSIDWADAAADNFHADIYNPMRRGQANLSPMERHSIPIRADGFPDFIYDDDEEDEWLANHPRRPIR